jgi:hypothetical protein
MNTLVSTLHTSVIAAKKMGSVAFTLVYKAFTIGNVMSNIASPFPSWLFSEVQPARIIINSGLIQEIHQQMERIIKHNKNGKCALQNMSIIIFNYLFFFAMKGSIERKPRLYCVKQRPESRLLRS